MAKYSDIKGFTVQTVSSDPAATQLDTGTWASGGDLNTARAGCTGTSDSTTNSIMMGGYYLPPTVNRSVTEAYDGTSWTELADIPISVVYGNGLGVKTASMVAGADISAAPKNSNAYIFNGSSWTAPGASLNTMKFMSATGGTTTAGIVAGGNNPPGTPKESTTETWDGTSFTEVADLNTAKSDIGGGTGTSTALMSASGNPSTTEIYNGSSWTEIAELNTARQNASKGGTITAAIVSNGLSGSTYYGQTEMYDGTSWTEVGDTPTTFGYGGNLSSGNSNGQNNSIIAGGQNNEGQTARTLEWTTTPSALFSKSVEGQLYFNSTTNTFKETLSDIPAATWASAPSINTTRWGMGSAARGTDGTNENALIFGGGTPPAATALTEEWNGSAWSEDNDLNTARKDTTGFGATYTSAVCAGGNTPPRRAQTETWNGSSWTEVTDLNTARSGIAGTGTVTSGIVSSGATDGGSTGATETWDGSSWTEVTDLNTSRSGGAMSGDSSTSALLADGSDTKVVEQWDGTSWTEIAELNQERNDIFGGIGNVTSAIVAGGYSPAPISPVATVNVERWDGTSWTEINNLSTGRASPGSQGSATSAMVQGGYTAPGAGTGTTETFTVALTNKTITAS